MDNIFDDMRAALAHARNVQAAADQQADGFADLLKGRCHKLTGDRSAALKKELERFNMRTGRWSVK